MEMETELDEVGAQLLRTTEEACDALNLLRQCRPILRLSGVAASAQAGHMAGLGIESLEALEALRARVDAALAPTSPT